MATETKKDTTPAEEVDYELERPAKTRRRVRLERLMRYFNTTRLDLRDTDCCCVGSAWMEILPITGEEIDQAIQDAKVGPPLSDNLKLAFYKLKFFPLKEGFPEDTIIVGRMCDKGA